MGRTKPSPKQQRQQFRADLDRHATEGLTADQVASLDSVGVNLAARKAMEVNKATRKEEHQKLLEKVRARAQGTPEGLQRQGQDGRSPGTDGSRKLPARGATPNVQDRISAAQTQTQHHAGAARRNFRKGESRQSDSEIRLDSEAAHVRLSAGGSEAEGGEDDDDEEDDTNADYSDLSLEWRPRGHDPKAETKPWVRDKSMTNEKMVKHLKARLGFEYTWSPRGFLISVILGPYARAVRTLATQRTVWWNRRHLTDDDAKIIATWIGVGALKSVKTFSLYGNDFTDVGTNVLFETLMRADSPPVLKTLNLSGSKMTPEGAPALARALCTPSLAGVSLLALNANRLGDHGLRVLMESWKLGGLRECTDLGQLAGLDPVTRVSATRLACLSTVC